MVHCHGVALCFSSVVVLEIGLVKTSEVFLLGLVSILILSSLDFDRRVKQESPKKKVEKEEE